MHDWIVHVWSAKVIVFWLFSVWFHWNVNLTSSMYCPDKRKNEISYKQQPSPKHQNHIYRDDPESDGGSTQSKSRTKFYKPNTEVHRTQLIFGLKGQKAAAKRRRFDEHIYKKYICKFWINKKHQGNIWFSISIIHEDI